MAKRRKHEDSGDEDLHYPAQPPAEMPDNPPPLNPNSSTELITEVPHLEYLEHIRARYINSRTDIARTIGELEAQRDEIEATIAFLKSQRR